MLVVEDDRDSAAMLVLLLQHDGHEVRSAHDGRSALEIAADFRPQIVVLDLRLGDMTGYDLAAALRAAAETKGAAIVALTGLDGQDVLARCRASGIERHFLKPIRDMAAFRGLLRSLAVPGDARA